MIVAIYEGLVDQEGLVDLELIGVGIIDLGLLIMDLIGLVLIVQVKLVLEINSELMMLV